jgi:hypothetical protein
MSLRGRKVRGWKEDADENDDTSLLCLAPLAKKRNIRLENEPDDTSTGSDELTLEYLFTSTLMMSRFFFFCFFFRLFCSLLPRCARFLATVTFVD